MRYIRILLSLFLIPILTGCNTFVAQTAYTVIDPIYISKNFYISPDFKRFNIKRVLMAPIRNETDCQDAPDKLDNIFFAEWSKLNKFEMVFPSRYLCDEFESNIHQIGKFQKIELADLAQRYNVDAILFTTLSFWFCFLIYRSETYFQN